MLLPRIMRAPRKAKPIHQTEKAWYYVNHKTIDIFAQSKLGQSTIVRMTRRQLQQALAIMDKHAET